MYIGTIGAQTEGQAVILRTCMWVFIENDRVGNVTAGVGVNANANANVNANGVDVVRRKPRSTFANRLADSRVPRSRS